MPTIHSYADSHSSSLFITEFIVDALRERIGQRGFARAGVSSYTCGIVSGGYSNESPRNVLIAYIPTMYRSRRRVLLRVGYQLALVRRNIMNYCAPRGFEDDFIRNSFNNVVHGRGPVYREMMSRIRRHECPPLCTSNIRIPNYLFRPRPTCVTSLDALSLSPTPPNRHDCRGGNSRPDVSHPLKRRLKHTIWSNFPNGSLDWVESSHAGIVSS